MMTRKTAVPRNYWQLSANLTRNSLPRDTGKYPPLNSERPQTNSEASQTDH